MTLFFAVALRIELRLGWGFRGRLAGRDSSKKGDQAHFSNLRGILSF
jgi:hypothetical protein